MPAWWSDRALVARAAPALLVFLFLVGYCVLSGRFPYSSGEVELLFPNSSQALEAYNLESRYFDDSYTDVIAFSLPADLPTSEADFLLEEFEEDLLAMEEIVSLQFPRRTSASGLFGLKSSDGKYFRTIVRIKSSLSEEEKRNFHSELNGTLMEYSSLFPLRAGSFSTSQEVSQAVSAETEKIIPWIVTILVVLLTLLFQRFSLVSIILASNGLAILTSLLLFSAFGYPLGPVSQLSPPFLLAVGTSFHLHFAVRILRTDKRDWPSVERELRSGIGLAAFTTAGSIISLVLLDVTDVTRFACLTAGGVLLCALYSCFLQPIFLRRCRDWEQPLKLSPKIFYRLSHGRMVAFTIAFALFLGVGVWRLEVHTDPLEFLPASSSALSQIRTMNSIFSGNHFLSIIVSSPDNGPIPTDFHYLEDLQTKLAQHPLIERVITVTGVVAERDEKASSDFAADFSLWSGGLPPDFVTHDQSKMRFLIETQAEGRDLLHLRDDLDKILSRTPSLRGLEVHYASFELVMASQTKHIIDGLIQSLGVTVGVVFLLLVFVLQDFRVASLGLVPNILPLLVVFGLLGLTIRDLDLGSCLVASSALGVAVDNTFHFLLCWKQNRMNEMDRRRATFETVKTVYAPFCLATFTLLCAFSVMGFAQSAPVFRFGILLALTLLVGLFADLVVLPYCLGGSLRDFANEAQENESKGTMKCEL